MPDNVGLGGGLAAGAVIDGQDGLAAGRPRRARAGEPVAQVEAQALGVAKARGAGQQGPPPDPESRPGTLRSSSSSLAASR